MRGFAGAFVALFCAAALVCACGMLLETGLTGWVPPERYAGAPVVVSGDQNVHTVKANGKHKAKPHTDRAWLPASLAGTLARVPGVQRVVAEVTFPAYLPGVATTQSWGHGWESAALTPFTLAGGHAPQRADEIVVQPAAHLAVGASVPVQTPTGIGTYRVVGVTAQSLPHQNAVFFSTAEAKLLAGRPGQVAAFGIFPKVAESAVQRALTGTTAQVHEGDGRGSAEFPGAAAAGNRLISMGAPMAGTALVVGILAVVAIFGLAVQQREREFALLRAIAATPRQVRFMVVRQVLGIGLLAAPAGALAGLGVGWWLYGRLVALGSIPTELPLHIGPFAPVGAAVATVLAGLVAARIAARRVARIAPARALGEASIQPARMPVVRVLLGLVALAGGVVLTVLLSGFTSDAASGPVTPLNALLYSLAVALLGPLLLRVLFPLLGLVLRLVRPTGELAAANLRAGARRMSSVVAPLSLMVAMACSMFFAQTTLSHAATAQAAAGNLADYQAGPNAPQGAAATLRKVPGVQTVTEVMHTTVRTGLTNRSAQGVTPAGLTATMDLRVTAGSLAGLGTGTMAAADDTGYRLGQQVALTLADGTPVTLRVVALYGRGLGFGDLTLDHAMVAAHVDVPFDAALLVAAPQVPRATLARALAAYPGLGVLDRAGAQAARSDTSTSAAYLGLKMIVGFAAVSAVNTLVLLALGRSRELALLRLVGATRRQILRMLSWETLTAAAVAVALGTAISVAVLVAYATGMTGTATPHVPPLGYLAVVAATVLLALAATALAARAVLRARPADAIGTRD